MSEITEARAPRVVASCMTCYACISRVGRLCRLFADGSALSRHSLLPDLEPISAFMSEVSPYQR
jgi:hypothetical protein